MTYECPRCSSPYEDHCEAFYEMRKASRSLARRTRQIRDLVAKRNIQILLLDPDRDDIADQVRRLQKSEAFRPVEPTREESVFAADSARPPIEDL